jgi:hypothetical protein
MQGTANLTHRPGNKLSRPKSEKKSYKRTSKLEASLNGGNTNRNENTSAKGN